MTCAALASPALAQGPSFSARVGQTQVGVGEAFVYEVTLSVSQGGAESFRRPEFRGLRVISERPSQSTQFQMGVGGTVMQQNFSWRYELVPLQKGKLTIGPAAIRVDGKDLKTESIAIQVVDAGQAPQQTRRTRPGGIPGFPGFPGFEPDEEPDPAPTPPPAAQEVKAAGRRNFVRASANKAKVFVGEPVVAEWTLYLTETQNKYTASKEPRTDGFWVEDLQIPTHRGNLALSEQVVDGRVYLVAPIIRKLLFPLSPGTHTVTPLEADISRVDFFGTPIRSEHLKSEPITVEVVPLPTQGKPANFDNAAVGTFAITAQVDKTQVNVGDALTLTVVLSGKGNVRKVGLPAMPKLDGAKLYDPKVSVNIEPGETLKATKTAEYLFLPERPGTLRIPSLTFASFDPEKGAYTTQKTTPFQIEVTGTAMAAAATTTTSTGRPGTENLIALDLRPPRNLPGLRRDLGLALFQSSTLLGIIAFPPALMLALFFARKARARLSRETDDTRRRKLRKQADRRLRTAANFLTEGHPQPALTEIERVLREYLLGKLGQPIAGMSRDELREALQRAGGGADVVDSALRALDTCDRARFAPGGLGQEEASATIDQASEILAALDRLDNRPAKGGTP